MSEDKKASENSAYTGGDKFFGQILKSGIADELFIKEIVVIFMEESRQSMSKLKEAAIACDLENVQLFAHKLKSSFLMFEMVEAHQLASQLEHYEEENYDEIILKINTLENICKPSFKTLKNKYLK